MCSLYLGENLISGAIPNSANKSLSNLDSAGQDKFDAKLNNDYSYLSLFGNPSLTADHILSGFSTKSYAQLPIAFRPGNSTWEMLFKVTLGSKANKQPIIGQASALVERNTQMDFTTDGYLQVYLSSDGATSDIENGDTVGVTAFNSGDIVYVKFEFTGNAYNVYSSTNGTVWTNEITISNSTPIHNENYPCLVGYNYYNAASTEVFNGSIDLKACYIKINNSYQWRGVTEASNLDAIANIRGKESLNKVDKNEIWYNSSNSTLYIGVPQS